MDFFFILNCEACKCFKKGTFLRKLWEPWVVAMKAHFDHHPL